MIKDINIKHKKYYLPDNMVNLKFDLSMLKIDKKSYKRINIYCIEYITFIHDNIYSLNLLSLIIHDAIGYFKEKNENKYLILDSTSGEVKEKYSELSKEIKREIKTNGGKESYYGKDCMKIKIDTDEKLPSNKSIKFLKIAVIIKSVFENSRKL